MKKFLGNDVVYETENAYYCMAMWQVLVSMACVFVVGLGVGILFF